MCLKWALFGNPPYVTLGRVFFYLEDVDIRAYFRCSSKSPTTALSSSRDSTSGSSSSEDKKEVPPTTKKPCNEARPAANRK